MADENGVKIDSGELLSFMECSICCSEYTDPTITKCGHTFCKPCIDECINRNHECPECKRTVTKDDIMKNIQIERLQRQIHELHGKAKNEIVDNILALEGGVMKSPIVAVFQANFKDSLMRFERYSDEARKEMEDSKKKIKSKYGAGGKDIDISKMKPEDAFEISNADRKYKLAVDYLVQAYDKYMKDVLPEPNMLPIKFNILVPSKGIKLENCYLRPNDSIEEARLLVEKNFLQQLNPIIKWGADCHYILLDPMRANGEQTEEEKEKIGQMISFGEEMKHLAQYKIYPGTVIEIYGTIVCESDVPKPCMSLKFNKDDKKAYNYYSCETCSINWVCEPCIQQCHKGHSYKDYLKNHIPTWACCYCVKKACTLPNKVNPLGSMIMSKL